MPVWFKPGGLFYENYERRRTYHWLTETRPKRIRWNLNRVGFSKKTNQDDLNLQSNEIFIFKIFNLYKNSDMAKIECGNNAELVIND